MSVPLEKEVPLENEREAAREDQFARQLKRNAESTTNVNVSSVMREIVREIVKVAKGTSEESLCKKVAAGQESHKRD